MKRKLASIQIVDRIAPIDGADAIEKISVLGWTLVAKKQEFRPGERCVFFEIDSLLPQTPPFECRTRRRRDLSSKTRPVTDGTTRRSLPTLARRSRR